MSLRVVFFLLLAILSVRPLGAETVTSPTMRIISSAPNLTGMVYQLGLGDSLVGVSTHTFWPEEARDLPQVADLFQPNLEAMLRLQPTHILGLDSTTRLNEFFGQRPGVQLMTTGRMETLEEIDASFLEVASFLGRRELAEAQLARRVSAPRKVGEGERLRVMFVLGYGAGLSQLYVIGQGTYVSELLEKAGGQNVVPDHLGIYPSLNKETLIGLRPDVIVTTARMGGESARYRELQRDWRPLATIPAVRRGDFRFIVEPSFLIPGPWVGEMQPMMEKLLWETEAGGSVSFGD